MPVLPTDGRGSCRDDLGGPTRLFRLFPHLKAAFPLGGLIPKEEAARRGEVAEDVNEISVEGRTTRPRAFPACLTETTGETADAVTVLMLDGSGGSDASNPDTRTSCDERAKFPDGAKGGSGEVCEPPPISHPELPPEWKLPGCRALKLVETMTPDDEEG